MILPCTCRHEFQDRRLGKGMRYHNDMKNGMQRCTVCRDEKGITFEERAKMRAKALEVAAKAAAAAKKAKKAQR